tara:strand:+ start:23873 stop:25213 length:1341 start_codon:yes stop_codon:yes gene_type:complete
MKVLYKFFPVWFQHLIITIVNNYKYYLKYGAIPFYRPLKQIISELDSKNLNDNNVLERINQLLKYAVNNVDYYKQNKQKYKPLKSISEIKKLPVLKKSTLKKFNKKFISKESTFFNTYRFKTSGSTGTPIRGSISKKDLKLRHKLILTSFKDQNIDYSLRLARFVGADIADKKNIFRYDFINKHFLFSIYNLSQNNIIKYHKALKTNKIQIIEGYPSTIYSLAKLLKESNLFLTDVKHVLTTAEKLLDYQKIEIEKFFNVKIFDFYGSSEGSAYMFSKENFYLNSNLIAYFEVVDENYKDAKYNDGQMLITSFTSSFTPLIRYAIGDLCRLKSINDQIIKVDEIIGRQDDVYISPDGIEFSRFSLILKYLPEEVLESELCLYQGKNKAILNYASDKPIELKSFAVFESKLNQSLNMKFSIKYQRVKFFKKINRGKLSPVKIINEED